MYEGAMLCDVGLYMDDRVRALRCLSKSGIHASDETLLNFKVGSCMAWKEQLCAASVLQSVHDSNVPFVLH
jgi:hypothetical protein